MLLGVETFHSQFEGEKLSFTSIFWSNLTSRKLDKYPLHRLHLPSSFNFRFTHVQIFPFSFPSTIQSKNIHQKKDVVCSSLSCYTYRMNLQTKYSNNLISADLVIKTLCTFYEIVTACTVTLALRHQFLAEMPEAKVS